MKVPIKFRGKPHSSERMLGVKYVYGGYYKDSEGREYIITQSAMWRVLEVAQLVGWDCFRHEVYTGDRLTDEVLNEHVARLGDSTTKLSGLRLIKCKEK